MRHRKKKKILGRDSSHNRALLRNLTISFFHHQKIKTSIAKTKSLKPFVEKLITMGKTNNKHTINYLNRKLGNQKIGQYIVNNISPRYKDRSGGYTRIIRLGRRRSDGTEIALLELV